MKSQTEIDEKKRQLLNLLFNGHLSPVSKGRVKSVLITLKWFTSNEDNLIQNLDLITLRGYNND